ncbi:hypothetical protein H696_00289 [Fonticula alba]|uniref:Uncharacterized protein n=1 Tax=Fonticula alba TaxID=691883 RepID=A0A058ZFI2_FONAL|nr:hypothetical protein H696_00289 [Fonticula alba]KCV72711.1 hypothetical protein H696_00289 [Fonticula alba]|eukprot:XP_009492412.1 hypothetical protein H696_00289 [Fonticula alba]
MPMTSTSIVTSSCPRRLRTLCAATSCSVSPSGATSASLSPTAGSTSCSTPRSRTSSSSSGKRTTSSAMATARVPRSWRRRPLRTVASPPAPTSNSSAGCAPAPVPSRSLSPPLIVSPPVAPLSDRGACIVFYTLLPDAV